MRKKKKLISNVFIIHRLHLQGVFDTSVAMERVGDVMWKVDGVMGAVKRCLGVVKKKVSGLVLVAMVAVVALSLTHSTPQCLLYFVLSVVVVVVMVMMVTVAVVVTLVVVVIMAVVVRGCGGH